ncbi:MAG: glycosyltransferase [Lachnospiraceae bacterium]|nr:glycosyltransferase [Lachnospiraceae bacterium]
MIFIQFHQTVTNHDAIGNDIEIIHRILSAKHDSYVYADNQFNKKVNYIEKEELESLIAKKDTVILYHHSGYWKEGYDILKKAKCRIIFRYHNITPPEFFEKYNEGYFNVCMEGRKQTEILCKEFPDAYWFCDSVYNSKDIVGVSEDRISICAPFNKMEEWGRAVPDEDILEALVESREKNILFVGRVVPNKGHLMLLDIIRTYISYYGPEIKLRVIGKFIEEIEGYNDIVRQKIAEYGIEDNIEFIGEINDSTLMSYYLGSDVMLVCSEHEGFCVPVVEAQFFGLPVVALSKCAVPETIGKNQVLLDSDVYRYAAAIKVITENEKYANCLEQNGIKNYKDRFSFEKISECFTKELHRMIGVEL